MKCPGARGLELPDDRRPGLGCDLEIAGVVAAGRPVGPPDGPLGRFDFSDAFGGDDKMMLRVRGRSMVDAGILDGDYIVVRQADDAESGAKVVVRVDGAFTLKIYRKRQGKVWLDACNKEVPPMPLTALDEPRIVGVYVGLVRQG